MGASSSSSRVSGRSAKEKSAQTTFKWRIDGFSSLLDKGSGWTYSKVFEMMGINWYLKLNPRDRKSGDEKEYVSLKLELSNTSLKPYTVVDASFKFLIYDQAYGKHSEHQDCKHIVWDLMYDSPKNTEEFIRVVTAKANDKSETLFVQKMNTFNEAKVFLTIHPSGHDKNGNYLSLYLHMKTQDTHNQNSAYLVEYSITIKDQETGKNRKETAPCQFSKDGNNWGWNKFMSLEDFKDSSNGYLVKTKCCIEAEVAIVGSSMME
uniref:MATH domain-containing protein n=1 Tax=Oryza punctata TaxID=4537 RepID=A0A0E0M8T3_ORYPU